MGQEVIITKADIEAIFKQLQEIIIDHGHFDHLVRATEEYLHSLDSNEIRQVQKLVKQKRKSDPKYVLTEKENNILNHASDKVFYRIEKTPSAALSKGQGNVIFFDRGASLFYSSDGNYLEQHITISHELAHIIFHTFKDDDWNRKIKKTENNITEIQASYFAEIAMTARTEQFKDPTFVGLHRFDVAQIIAVIKGLQPYYDANKLAK